MLLRRPPGVVVTDELAATRQGELYFGSRLFAEVCVAETMRVPGVNRAEARVAI